MRIVTEKAGACLDSTEFFEKSARGDFQSPIDEFIEAVIRINRVAPTPAELSNELGQLMILGYVSAVESFVRALIRCLINVDEASQRGAYGHQVSFAAAKHSEMELLPEALLEQTQFTSRKRIEEAVANFLDLNKGQVKEKLEPFCSEYDKVCQLRHCVVHRFGKLGSQNALALGFSEHKEYLEEKMSVDYAKVQLVADICDNTVRGVNNVCYDLVMKRSHNGGWVGWHGDLRKDRAKYRPYYSIFASTNRMPASPPLKSAYDEFRRNVLLA